MMQGIAVPFPQKASRTYELSGTVRRPLLLGKFFFDPAVITEVKQMRKGVLYRILSASFSANCSEVEFRAAFRTFGPYTEPFALLTLNGVTATPKGWPVRDFYQGRPTLNYVEPSADNQVLGISFAGTFNGGDIPGLASLDLSYSFTVQELASESFKLAYEQGKF